MSEPTGMIEALAEIRRRFELALKTPAEINAEYNRHMNYNPERDYPPTQDEKDEEIRQELAGDAWAEVVEASEREEEEESEIRSTEKNPTTERKLIS